jgi:hypothetical protein
MEKRALQRIPVCIDVEFKCCNKNYRGTVTNMSEKGMHVSIRDMSFPCLLQFEICFLLKEGTMNVPVKIVRLIKSPDARDELGLQLENPNRKYLDFVNDLK